MLYRYMKQRLGVNSIDNMMKSVVKNTPLHKSRKKLSKHTVRKTVAKKLRAASVERQSITILSTILYYATILSQLLNHS